MTSVREVLGWIEGAYPPGLAEDWDRVGLDVGDPDAAVTSVAFGVDPTEAVIAEARERGADLLVTHHPLLLRGAHAIRADEPKGRAVLALVRAGIAHVAAHTNADHAERGVSDALAAALRLGGVRPLVPLPAEPPSRIVPSAPGAPAEAALGTGRVGELPEPCTAEEVARRLAGALPATAGGVRLGGEPSRLVRTVAVVGGAGDAFLDAARRAGVDLYVTSDLRHHPAQDFLAWPDAPALIDVAHSAAEALWLPVAEALVRARADAAGAGLSTYVSRLVTDPWALRV